MNKMLFLRDFEMYYSYHKPGSHYVALAYLELAM